MNLTIELDRETDGRWIAEVPALNVLIYGAGRDEAIRKAETAAMEIIADRIQRGTLPPDAAKPVFAVAA
jgi:predicted RNase H-like HicB family nuclease